MTKMDILKATALPIPCEVPRACPKLKPYGCLVKSHRWIAVVQMTRISVKTY